ncbi:MAG: DUF2442 domain-containing protein [Bacteroidetes bacterium]|nr:DUF2442 domain-containing protein [Bacteroidota bacterium]
MSKAIGYTNISPRIKAVRFPKGKIVLHLVDGRIIIIPANKFPEIEHLSAPQKRRYNTLAGMGLMFESLDTVFHITDFIGKDFSSEILGSPDKNNKKYIVKKSAQSKAAERVVKYGKS